MYYENNNRKLTINIWRNSDFALHVHYNAEILICTEGELTATCNSETRNLKQGDVAISFPNDIHSYTKSSGGTGYMIIFNPVISDLISSSISQKRYNNFAYVPELLPVLDCMYDNFANNSQYEIIYGYLHIIWGHIINKLSFSENAHEGYSDLFSDALKYVSEKYTEPITLKSTAKHCGVDQAHLSRVFSQKIPGGFNGYIHQLRVEHAKHLLEKTDNTIYDILLESGFSNQRTFNRVFKNITKTSPKEYRSKTRNLF